MHFYFQRGIFYLIYSSPKVSLNFGAILTRFLRIKNGKAKCTNIENGAVTHDGWRISICGSVFFRIFAD